MKTPRNPSTVHPPIGAYTHQVEIGAGERLLVLSGQVGRALDGQVPESQLEQIDLAFQNLERNLQAAGMGIPDLVKLTFYLVGEVDPAERRKVFAAHLGDHLPCATLVYVTALAAPIYKVEIDAWASKA